MTLDNWIGFGTFVLAIVAAVVALRKGKNDRASSIEDRMSNLEADFRLLEDYCNEMRGSLSKAGQPVPPWPEGLTTRR